MKLWTLPWIIDSALTWAIIIALFVGSFFIQWWLLPLSILAALLRIHSDRFIHDR